MTRQLRVGAALALANLRYWPTVAPLVSRELRCWRSHADAIPAPNLKALALAKLREEHFNARVAATLATLAPPRHRADATAAIVAYQIAYDYLDALTEQPVDAHLDSNRRLYTALSDAFAPEGAPGAEHCERKSPHGDDGGYLRALSRAAGDRLARLPGAEAVRPAMSIAARRCAEAQARVHATGWGEPAELAVWARAQAQSSPLGWREWLAGAVSSVLGIHALIAAATQAAITPPVALALDEAYLPIAALSTMLDGLVDWREDHRSGRTPWLLSLYGGASELTGPLLRTAGCATDAASKLPRAAHHLMTMTGVVAYYSSSPAAAEPHARPAVAHLHRELPAPIAPTLTVMRAWRTAQQGLGARRIHMMRPSARLRRDIPRGGRTASGIAAVLLVAAVLLIVAGVVPAIASKMLSVKDSARLRLVGSHQNTLIETGTVTGTIPGTVRVSFTLHGFHAASRFTIRAKGGTLSGVGEGTVKSGKTGYDTFGGSLRLTGGTGAYRGASGSGGLYGSLYKLDESLRVQVYGTLHHR